MLPTQAIVVLERELAFLASHCSQALLQFDLELPGMALTLCLVCWAVRLALTTCQSGLSFWCWAICLALTTCHNCLFLCDGRRMPILPFCFISLFHVHACRELSPAPPLLFFPSLSPFSFSPLFLSLSLPIHLILLSLLTDAYHGYCLSQSDHDDVEDGINPMVKQLVAEDVSILIRRVELFSYWIVSD